MVKDAEAVLGEYVWGRYDLLGINITKLPFWNQNT